jgi:hypothetical protein
MKYDDIVYDVVFITLINHYTSFIILCSFDFESLSYQLLFFVNI